MLGLWFQVIKEVLAETNEENEHSSDDYTLSPSDEEHEHTLDCGPSAQTDSHEPEAKDRPTLESELVSEGPHRSNAPTNPPGSDDKEPEEPPPGDLCPTPKPRQSWLITHSQTPSPPTARPRTVLLYSNSPPDKQPTAENSRADPDFRPKQSLRKLQLTHEEKTQLVNLHSISADSDSETPGGSSSCSSSSATAGGPSPPKPGGLDGQEEEGYWSGSTASHIQEKKTRRCYRRKEMPSGQARVRSKFSPWNLSSPRISRDTRLSVLADPPAGVGKRRLSPLSGPVQASVPNIQSFLETAFRHVHSPSEEGADEDEDEDDFETLDDSDALNEKVRGVSAASRHC